MFFSLPAEGPGSILSIALFAANYYKNSSPPVRASVVKI